MNAAHVPFLLVLLRGRRRSLTQPLISAIVQYTSPSPNLLFNHLFTLCCLSRISLSLYLLFFSPPLIHHALSCLALTPTNWRMDEEDGEDESGASRGGVHDNLYRVHMPSLYSCGSSYGSEASLPATAHTVSNAPVTEYMWVSTHR